MTVICTTGKLAADDISAIKKDIKYIIISPVRDEEKYIEKTIKSVISQTITPFKWVIVNDGSADKTGEIIDSYSKKYDWIITIHRKNRGYRKSGSGVMEAFYEGYAIVNCEYDFIVKLDGDLSFGPDFFEKCFDQCRKNPKLGIVGGVIYSEINGIPTLEKQPAFHVRGATKVYKKECWDAIGGLIKEPGWDTLDEIKANMLGWKTESLSFLHVIQHRVTGGADGALKNLLKNGKGSYISGYHPLYMALKCIENIFHPPYLIGSICLLLGYIGAFLKGVKQIEDKTLIKYLQKQQLNKILLKESIWN